MRIEFLNQKLQSRVVIYRADLFVFAAGLAVAGEAHLAVEFEADARGVKELYAVC